MQIIIVAWCICDESRALEHVYMHNFSNTNKKKRQPKNAVYAISLSLES